MSKRRTHSPEFKARVTMEAISGRKTIKEIAEDHAIHPIQVSQLKRQLLDGARELFTRGNMSQDPIKSKPLKSPVLPGPRKPLWHGSGTIEAKPCATFICFAEAGNRQKDAMPPSPLGNFQWN
ncbi:transposase [Synechococcus sp. 1G10]|uniref:transposase n=1 Tax=Synechococcus sp. 1G10 TaxID=2025605 RepID=UPI002100756B|nr:transposase [Synechococcus sp. 1G10]